MILQEGKKAIEYFDKAYKIMVAMHIQIIFLFLFHGLSLPEYFTCLMEIMTKCMK